MIRDCFILVEEDGQKTVVRATRGEWLFWMTNPQTTEMRVIRHKHIAEYCVLTMFVGSHGVMFETRVNNPNQMADMNGTRLQCRTMTRAVAQHMELESMIFNLVRQREESKVSQSWVEEELQKILSRYDDSE